MSEARIVALIPARAGSKRVEGKNTRLLNGHPLLSYAIGAAQESGIFDGGIWVSSDSDEVQRTVLAYRVGFIHRSANFARDDSPDIEWASAAMKILTHSQNIDAFAIIRPTSPFRRGRWIRKAWEILQACPRADSIRAVRPCGEHPAKMWRRIGITETQARSFRRELLPAPARLGLLRGHGDHVLPERPARVGRVLDGVRGV